MSPTGHDDRPPLATLLAGVARAHEGDPDAIADVVTDDVTWVDDDEHRAGVDEVVEHFLAHGGWREVFEVRDVVRLERPASDRDGDVPEPGGAGLAAPDQDASGTPAGHWRVDWTLWLRADSTSYRRDGVAEVVVVSTPAGARIAGWTATATEREDGSLAPWGGD